VSRVASAVMLLLAGCGESPLVRCEVVEASIDPAVYVLGNYEIPMLARAATESCDPKDDRISISAVIEESTSFHIADLADHGIDTDTTAGDGVYERTMLNPFIVEGDGLVRFSPCDPDCREPAFEVAVHVDPQEPPL